MDDNKKLALELTKALIQNQHIKPVFSYSKDSDIGEENSISYILDNTKYSFTDLFSYFLDNLEKINERY
ncbi:hypothetical protein [Bacillus sp. FJAT-45350]|uniref:hypothetical protein n=1 Tax=Bacillus sp. FJAT-45350 TaxID=2011014 RepID=UPI000BB8B760|nr:hypothetical protein [Bacillus sp. FJAT-45350]